MNSISKLPGRGINTENSLEEAMAMAMAIGGEVYIKGSRSKTCNDYLLFVSGLKPD